MTEKRRYHRMPVRVPMKFRVPPEKKEFTASTLNLSGTGISFLASKEVRERQELLIYLELPGEDDIEIHAKVVRVERKQGEGFRVSVKIMDPIKFDEKKFIRFYSKQLAGHFGKS